MYERFRKVREGEETIEKTHKLGLPGVLFPSSGICIPDDQPLAH